VGNIFEDIPRSLESEAFDLLAKGSDVRIERIISKGHTSPETGWYDQEQHEWVMVLKGKAVVDFPDKSPVTLAEGDFITINAHEKHRVEWTDPDSETIWLAVHYHD